MTNPPKATSSLLDHIDSAIEARADFFDAEHQSAFRLFNGFYEGYPELSIDLYGGTLVLFDYSNLAQDREVIINQVIQFIRNQLPWLRSVVWKRRKSLSIRERRGILLGGELPDQVISELGVSYAVDLLMSQEASFFLDTRNVRSWALESLEGKTVLNTFAYTGTLGIAAQAGGAKRVIHLDRQRKYLNLAKASYALNGLQIDKSNFITGDFFKQTRSYRKSGQRFDCVIVDPPFFAKTRSGTIDMLENSHRLINKVRPLVNDGGYLLVINNALFLNGEEYYKMLTSICAAGYGSIETLIPVPADCTGYRDTIQRSPPVDPSPFNHPTKIALLRFSS